MPDLSLSLYCLHVLPGQSVHIPGTGLALVLAHEGALMVAGNLCDTGQAQLVPAGTVLDANGETGAVALAYVLSDGPAAPDALASEQMAVEMPCVVRLDEVAFPPGAQAYRHVHAGAGFRHLRWGQLRLEADDHAFDAHPGDTWFEAANSPVRATATGDAPETRFLRCMVLPVAYQGKPTIRILDPEDAARPKRQVTHRLIDQRLERWPHVDAG